MQYGSTMREITRAALAGLAITVVALTTACYSVLSGDTDLAPVEDYSYEEPLSDAEAPEFEPDQQPGGGIAWDEATSYAGTSQRVCGPFAGWGNSTDDIFLNLGRDYPNPDRFQIVIWDIGGIEPIPPQGSTICTEGNITLYEGVAQIELYDPGVIEIYE